jgi:hypothetical protein
MADFEIKIEMDRLKRAEQLAETSKKLAEKVALYEEHLIFNLCETKVLKRMKRTIEKILENRASGTGEET